jgi:hypothetical protein
VFKETSPSETEIKSIFFNKIDLALIYEKIKLFDKNSLELVKNIFEPANYELVNKYNN